MTSAKYWSFLSPPPALVTFQITQPISTIITFWPALPFPQCRRHISIVPVTGAGAEDAPERALHPLADPLVVVARRNLDDGRRVACARQGHFQHGVCGAGQGDFDQGFVRVRYLFG